MALGRKILFLTISGRRGASSRYRVYDFVPRLERAGFEVTIETPAERKGGIGGLVEARREEAKLLEAASRSDIVFVQKRLLRAGFVRRLRKVSGRLVFDYDDAIFTSPAGDWTFLTRKKVHSRLGAVLGSANLVIAGNRYLYDHARAAGAGQVEVVPTSVDVSKYSVKEHGEGPAVLGWIGSSVNHRYLDMLGGVLPELYRRIAGLRLLVVSDRDYHMDGVEVENRRWSEKTEAADLLDMDIGLMPLEDNSWTRGKCALKALQYMACGLPAICSPVGANSEVVEHGVDGYLPAGDAEWIAAIAGLAKDPAGRAAMGAAGRHKVENYYSTDAVFASLAGLLERL